MQTIVVSGSWVDVASMFVFFGVTISHTFHSNLRTELECSCRECGPPKRSACRFGSLSLQQSRLLSLFYDQIVRLGGLMCVVLIGLTPSVMVPGSYTNSNIMEFTMAAALGHTWERVDIP